LKPANDPANPKKKYVANEDKGATLLGEEQWHWLERQLLKPANVRIVVSSIQFVADGHGYEKWGLFPKEKDRFIQLLKRTNAKNLFIVSGDRHRGTIAKMDIKGWGPLFDITASSINKPTDLDEEDPSYVGPQIKKENFGLALIDWHKKRIRFEVRDIENNIINKIETSLK
jgi:alkaline phosphatase D